MSRNESILEQCVCTLCVSIETEKSKRVSEDMRGADKPNSKHICFPALSARKAM